MHKKIEEVEDFVKNMTVDLGEVKDPDKSSFYVQSIAAMMASTRTMLTIAEILDERLEAIENVLKENRDEKKV